MNNSTTWTIPLCKMKELSRAFKDALDKLEDYDYDVKWALVNNYPTEREVNSM